MVVPVPDVPAATAFYEALLEVPADPVAEGTRPYFHCVGAILALANPAEHGDEFRPNPDHIYLAVNDLDEAHRRAQRVGAKRLGEIDVRPWGERSFYCQDPFGNPLCFVDGSTKFTGTAR